MSVEELVQDLMESQKKHIKNRLPITFPSIPILYFGDLENYQQSKHKIITVGLSPSHNEFPYPNRLSRFKDVEKLDLASEWSNQDIGIYLNSLNIYFKYKPYNWFDSFEPILNGMSASYYPGKKNTVLHTDICSPHATYPTWSKLGETQQNTLRNDGKQFWNTLVEILKPDLMLISVARKYANMIRFRKSKWMEHFKIKTKKDGTPRSKPYLIEVAESQIDTKKGYLVFGQAAQMPFGTLSTEHKKQVGEQLLTLLK